MAQWAHVMRYTVQQLAKLAGVSVRTLHHYDAVGLLVPARSEKNQYRLYTEQELLRLQQIMFFRELDFSIPDIKRIMKHPRFDMKRSLLEHKALIEIKRKRLTALIRTITQTINALDMNTKLDDEAMYAAFADTEGKKYADEARQRWGTTDAYQQSAQRTAKFTGADWKRIQTQNEEVMRGIAKHRSEGADSPNVQRYIEQHYNNLRAFYEPTVELYRGLADMYAADARFAANYEAYGTGMAAFMRDAMHVFANKKQG